MFLQETWRKMSDEAFALARIRALAMRKRTSFLCQVSAFQKVNSTKEEYTEPKSEKWFRDTSHPNIGLS